MHDSLGFGFAFMLLRHADIRMWCSVGCYFLSYVGSFLMLNKVVIAFSEGLLSLTLHIKDILKTLRELKKSSGLAYEMLKLLSDGQDSSIVRTYLFILLKQYLIVN